MKKSRIFEIDTLKVDLFKFTYTLLKLTLICSVITSFKIVTHRTDNNLEPDNVQNDVGEKEIADAKIEMEGGNRETRNEWRHVRKRKAAI